MSSRGSKPGERRGGRQAGTPNRRTAAREQALQAVADRIAATIEGAFEGDAHAYLVFIYKDPKQPTELRLDVAKAAIRFEKPSLASTTLKGDAGNPIGFVLVGAREPVSAKEWLAECASAAAG